MAIKENIILVDPKDKAIGEVEKHLAHRYGMLHRAFSVFIFRNRGAKRELLLQQRSKTKYHGAGLWTNTCCSHPHKGETLLNSAKKRLKEEMGIETPLKKAGKFHYIALFENGLVENEMDHVFVGEYDHDPIPFNPHEVAGYQWIKVSALLKELKTHPKKFTPWFGQALEIALDDVNSGDKK